MQDSNRITVGVPVYNGEAFLVEALTSIQQQTYREFEAIISLDGPSPATEELCQPFLKDSRFRLVIQPNRLGWVGNINWLMARVETPYWCYLGQDDVLDPRYLEVLLDFARHASDAAIVFCDIEAFGPRSWRHAQRSVTGDASARQLALLFGHHAAIAFRGLTQREAIHYSGGVPGNEVEDFSADTTWMAAAARWGELRRVPVALYRKRYHAENTHAKWSAWPEEKRVRAWIVHCTDMLQQAMLVKATAQERRLLWLAAVARLTSARSASDCLAVGNLNSTQREAVLNGFLTTVQTARSMDIPGLLEDRWENLQVWTKGFFLK